VAGRLLVRRRAAGGSRAVPGCAERRGSSAGDEGTDSRGNIESPDARETPKEATDGWGVEDVELPRAGADDAHRDPPVHAAEADARVGFPEGNAGRKSLETKTTDRETDAPYLDFSVKSPWERFARAVETTARAWLRLTDDQLRKLSTVNDSRPDHGSRDLRCLRAVVEHDNAHFRRDPYAVLLYFRDDAERPNVLAFGRNDARETPDEDAFPSDARNDARAKPFLRRSSISQRAICAPENDLAPGSVGVQRWFGAGHSAPFAVVEPLRANASSSVASVSRTFADVDEATAAKAAVAVAFAAAGVPSHWPVFAPVLGPARRAFVGRTGDDDANTLRGLVRPLRDRLAGRRRGGESSREDGVWIMRRLARAARGAARRARRGNARGGSQGHRAAGVSAFAESTTSAPP
jgi:hypothetical protein